MKRLCYSICASFSGEHPEFDTFRNYDTTLDNVIRDWPGETKPQPSEPFDSDYAYLAKEGGIPKRILSRLEDTRGDVRFQMIRKLREKFPRESLWVSISDIQVSGIFDRETLFDFLSNIGASYEDVESLGTLGGPLGGMVPDFCFTVESQCLISSIRITPVWCEWKGDRWEPLKLPSEEMWGRIGDIFSRHDPWDIKSHRAIGRN
jgi:hypothetical protein